MERRATEGKILVVLVFLCLLVFIHCYWKHSGLYNSSVWVFIRLAHYYRLSSMIFTFAMKMTVCLDSLNLWWLELSLNKLLFSPLTTTGLEQPSAYCTLCAHYSHLLSAPTYSFIICSSPLIHSQLHDTVSLLSIRSLASQQVQTRATSWLTYATCLYTGILNCSQD